MLTIDKYLLIDDASTPQFKLIELSDRGGLKYPSEIVFDSIIVVWKNFLIIEHNSELMSIFLNGPSRKILVDLALNDLENSEGFEIWRNSCASCRVCGWSIVRGLVFIASNCLIANKVKNYNSIVVSKGIEKRKLKKFNSNKFVQDSFRVLVIYRYFIYDKRYLNYRMIPNKLYNSYIRTSILNVFVLLKVC